MGDVDDDGVLDLIVGAGKDHAPEVVAYSGKASGGKGAFATELARFAAFAPDARGGVSVTATQIDGIDRRQHHRRLWTRHSERSQSVRLGAAGVAGHGARRSSRRFSPYVDDRSGVSVTSGFVDFSSGRNSIVTAPGPGSPAQVKVFNFSLMTPLEKPPTGGAAAEQCPGPRQAAITAAFMPFGLDYRGGVSLATGWLTGALGGAKRIVVGQLAGPGTVKVYSSGSALQGGPKIYLDSAMQHTPVVDFTEAASFTPFGGASGVSVATTSTTSGADLLVSGVSPQDGTVQILKYQFVRPTPAASMLQAVQLGQVASAAGALPAMLGGD